MTTEMGPRDVDLSLDERFAARMTQYVVRGIDALSDGPTIRFDDSTATLSLSGESESAGDLYERGQLATTVVMANMLLPAGLITLLTKVPVPPGGMVAALYFVGVLLPVAVFAILNVQGSTGLIGKIDVMDHTMPPQPEALDELQDKYVDGDLDEEEFGDQVAEVWANE